MKWKIQLSKLRSESNSREISALDHTVTVVLHVAGCIAVADFLPMQTTLCRYVTNPADDCPRTRGPCTTPLCGRHAPWARTGQWTPWPGWWIAAWYASVRMLVWCLSVAKTLFMVILLHAAWFLTTQVSLSKFLPRMLLLAATLVEHYLL